MRAVVLIRLLITIDAESTKSVEEGRIRHLRYETDIAIPCRKIMTIADRYEARVTFMLPIGEISVHNKAVFDLAKEMSKRHDIQVHLHRPFPLISDDEIVELIKSEMELIEGIAGHRPTCIRAGGYSVGEGGKWINCISRAGLQIDCSVWSGANIFTTRSIADSALAREEKRWGRGALYFDFRNAPLAGAYTPSADNLAQVGESAIVEIPISMRGYSEVDPWKYRLDPQTQRFGEMKETLFAYLRKAHETRDFVLEMIWHTNNNFSILRPLGIVYDHRSARDFEHLLRYIYIHHNRKDVQFTSVSELDLHQISKEPVMPPYDY